MVWSVLSRFGVGLLMGERKRRQGDKKNKGRFWRAKASLFGRESVAAFLVGDLGCAHRDQGGADFRLDAAVAPPTAPFRFETGVAHTRHFQVCRQSVGHARRPLLIASVASVWDTT